MAELVPSLTLHLVELFRGPLRDVRFPDADADRLGASVDAVLAANDLLAHAEAALAAAREALVDKQRLAAEETERTFAYARVYALTHPDVQTALDAVPSKVASGKRAVGRPRKAKVEAPASGDRAASAAE